MATIDLNCDLGEGLQNDALLMSFISSCNIACGFHAGNEAIMKRTVELALQFGVAIGAHPGFADRENFGRLEQHVSAEECYHLVTEQIAILRKITDSFQTRIHHVKPHGGLYNMSARDPLIARSIALAVRDLGPDLILYGLSGSHSVSEAKSAGLRTASEVFADRTYQDDGSLTPRIHPLALIENEEQSIIQVLQMVLKNSVTSVSGREVPIVAETICIHGDGLQAVELAAQIFHSLKQHQVGIAAL